MHECRTQTMQALAYLVFIPEASEILFSVCLSVGLSVSLSPCLSFPDAFMAYCAVLTPRVFNAQKRNLYNQKSLDEYGMPWATQFSHTFDIFVFRIKRGLYFVDNHSEK